jgi:hypothetical protein
MFPRINYAKIKTGVFVRSQIRELMQDVEYELQLNQVGTAAWTSFNNVTTNFGQNHKAENYSDIFADFVQL